VVATDGGDIPVAGQWPETTVNVPVGTTRDIEFIPRWPGDWAMHCHKTHHTMNPMGHDIPNTMGVDQKKAAKKIRRQVPGYMPMGEKGMGGMHEMGIPKNTLRMMTGKGPFGDIEMGGMFTILKVRDEIADYDVDPGWYTHPPGTSAHEV